MRPMARDGGFSLIEMMIVLTIAALVMAAFPIARGYLPQAHVNAATRGLAQTLWVCDSRAQRFQPADLDARSVRASGTD